MVRCIPSLRPEPPLVPSAEIPVVEGDLVVVQEIGRSSAAGISQRCLRHDSVSLYRGQARIKKGREDVPHFSEGPAERLLRLRHSELHLGHMSALMYGEHRRPRHGFRCIWGRNREHVHPSRGPCHRPVCSVVCMQDDRHASLVHVACAS